MNELNQQLDEAKKWLQQELGQISTGRANPSLLDSVKVSSYGTLQPIQSLASIITEDARTLRLSPWDKNQIKPIETAISEARLPVSIATDDTGVRVHVPALTEESKQQLIKVLKEKLEQARVRARSAREVAIKALQAGELSKDALHDAKETVQEQVDKAIEELQAIFTKKETDLNSI